MPSRISPIEPGEADDPEVDDRLRETAEEWYGDSAFFGAMAHRPVLLKRFMETFEAFGEDGSLDPVLFELVRLRVAAVHECAYCATVRTRAVEEAVEPKEAAVLGEELDTEPLSEREALAVELADELARDPQRITDARFEEFRAVFTDAALIELLLFASLEIGLDRFTVALRLDTTAASPYPTDLSYPFSRE